MENNTMRFGCICIPFVLSTCAFSQETATIDITTLVKDVEIVIDGKSLGCHDHIAVSVSPGRHMIEGRKPHHFTDWEKVKSIAGKTDTVTLKPRNLQGMVSAQVQPLFPFNNVNTPMLTINIGMRTPFLYIGTHLSESVAASPVFLFGCHADYLFDYKNLLELTAGAFVTYFEYSRDEVNDNDGNTIVPAIAAHGVSVAPEIGMLAGYEHFFFLLGISGVNFNGFCPMLSLGFAIAF
jgi:hypothetical protein